MKLIDANELVKAIENENPGLSISGAVEKFARIAQVNMQPTVEAIPIELYEQVKGERDAAVEQLKSLNIELFEKPYRKAIPIEYIEKFKKEFRAVASVKAVIDWLLEDWSKENEQSNTSK